MGKLKTLHTALRDIAADEELLGQYRSAAEAVSCGAAETLRAFIELGRAGCAIEDDIARSRRLSGQHATDDALRLLVTGLGVDRRALREASRVVRLFDAALLDSFVSRTDAAGRLITPGHLKAIARAETEDQRKQLVERFYVQALTVQQIGKAARPAPRNLQRARVVGIKNAVSQLCAVSNILASKIKHEEHGLRESLFDRLRAFVQGDGEPGPADLELVSRLRVTLEELQQVLAPAIELVADAEVALEDRLEPDDEA